MSPRVASFVLLTCSLPVWALEIVSPNLVGNQLSEIQVQQATTDLYGDPLPPGAIARVGTARLRHGGGVRSLVFSPDGKLLASCGNDGTVYLWEVATGKGRALKFDSAARCLTFAPDDKLLATGHQDHSIRVWNPASGKEVRRFSGHQGPVISLAFSPDGKRLASGAGRFDTFDTSKININSWDNVLAVWEADRQNFDKAVRIWDVATGNILHQLSGHEYGAKAIFFVAGAQNLVTLGHGDGKGQFLGTYNVRLWDATTGKELRQYKDIMAHLPYVFPLPATKTLLLLTWKNPFRGNIQFMDLDTGKFTQRLKSKEVTAEAIALSMDGERIVSVNDAKINLYTTKTGKLLRTFPGQTGKCIAAALSSNGRILATANAPSYSDSYQRPAIRLWDTATGKEKLSVVANEEELTFVRFLANSKTLLCGGPRVPPLFCDALTGKAKNQLKLEDMYWSEWFDLSADGRMLAVDGMGSMQLWDVTLAKKKAQGEGGSNAGLRLSPDGSILALAYDFRDLQELFRWGGARSGVWLTEVAGTNREPMLGKLPFPALNVGFLGLLNSPFGQGPFLLAPMFLGWNLPPFDGAFQGMAFSPNGKHLAISAGGLHLWDVHTKNKLWLTAKEKSFWLHSFCLGDKGLWGTAGGTIRRVCVWSTTSGKMLRQWKCATVRSGQGWSIPLTAQDPAIRKELPLVAALSPDGKLLALGPSPYSGDYSIQLRDFINGRLLGIVEGHQGDVNDLSFSKNGKYLASASNDGTVLVWDIAKCLSLKGPLQKPLPEAEIQQLWTELGSENEIAAYWAVDRLSKFPNQIIPLLKKHLRPVSGKGIDKLVSELTAAQFAQREKAARELELREYAAVPTLQLALANKPAEDLRVRLEKLLKKLEAGNVRPEVLRGWRALSVLARINTPEARAVLEFLATGAPEARLTQEAATWLKHLAKTP